MKILILSNGHGEDVIALKIIEELQKLPQAPFIEVLPLVGEGFAYRKLNIPLIAPVQKMPSGGFIYMETSKLWQDLRSGLLKLTFAQYQAIKHWAKTGDLILAVGDILPLFFAWLSGTNYAFVGTAKSEYYLRDEFGWFPQAPWLDRFFGSVYYPWECWLMRRRRCQAVFPRDTLTSQTLRTKGIRAFDLGNPMMDGIKLPSPPRFDLKESSLVILLLPGSRFPEALENWKLLLQAVDTLIQSSDFPLIFLAAIAPSLDLKPFQQSLSPPTWERKILNPANFPIEDRYALLFTQGKTKLVLSQNAYVTCLNLADMAIAMAGTATEQFVGLGKPVIAFPGKGPQYTRKFAENQGRLLGISFKLVAGPDQVGAELPKILKNPDLWQLLSENAEKRLGKAGAAQRIAKFLRESIPNFRRRRSPT
jgi:uncharacterized protein (TIGR03492 family)